MHNFSFVIFSLLIPFVHREGPIGHQARDALLLCMALSKKNTNIGMYIAKHSNLCPVLATGKVNRPFLFIYYFIFSL